MANSALAKYKATSEAEGWHYDFKDYVGEAPADEENFFMAKPFSGSLYTQNIGEKAVYLNPTIKTNVEAVHGFEGFSETPNPGIALEKIVNENPSPWGILPTNFGRAEVEQLF